MSKYEVQALCEQHLKAQRILSSIRANLIRLEFKRISGVVDTSVAILIHQNERLEYMYDNLICKMANVSISSRKVDSFN